MRRFGVGYSSACALDVGALLAQADSSSNGPRFYDPFLVQDSGELYPIPIQLLNGEGSLPVRLAVHACLGGGVCVCLAIQSAWVPSACIMMSDVRMANASRAVWGRPPPRARRCPPHRAPTCAASSS
jgi:hypothetical protein